MSLLPVSPTRMELSRLKKQLQMSERGYQLLKDKQDELMRQFVMAFKETQALRTTVEEKYRAVRHSALLAKSVFSEKAVTEDCLSAQSTIGLSIQTKNQMGVFVPIMSFDMDSHRDEAILSLSPGLGQSRQEMEQLLPMLLQLSQAEKHCVILSAEIEKTRRRVNALEYMTIPQLKETIRFIKMRLEDAERDRITRLIKMQDFEIATEH